MADKENKAKVDSKKSKKEEKVKRHFFKDFKAELKRVSWPTMKQLVNNTTAVIAIVLLVSAIVFILDVVFESLNVYGVEKLKALVTSSSSENLETEEHNHEEGETSNEAGESSEDANTDIATK